MNDCWLAERLMQVTYTNGLYLATGQHDPTIMKAGGWRWAPSRRAWMTSKTEVASTLNAFCVGEAKKKVDNFQATRKVAIAASSALDADIEIPAPEGLSYRPYQRAGIAFMLGRKDSLNGDGMRLGKTLEALGVINATPDLKNTLIICPATAKIHWIRESQKWLVHPLDADMCEGGSNPKSPLLVCNYDILTRHRDYIGEKIWDAVIFDESHYLKNGKSQRTRAALGSKRAHLAPILAKRRMFMSGTPLFKTPVDLWTMCEACDPSGLGKNFWNFVHRYCDAREDGYGLDTSGASNSEELQFLMRSRFMIRREKTDVAAEIPSNRQTIVLPQTGLERLVQREQSIVRRNLSNFEAMLNSGLTGGTVDEIVANFSQFDGIDRSETEEACPTCDGRGSPGEDVPCSQCGGTGAIERAVSARVLQYVEQAAELSTVRRELALQKVPMCVRWLEDLLTNEDKVVVFAHHRDVVAKLREAFPEAAVLIGGMTAKQKWEAIDRFNNDPACRVFIGNLVAAGQIINLSIADVVAFVEVSWVPSEMDQCEERIWDVEKVRPVSIYRLVVEGSLDERMCAVLEIRQKVIDRTMKVKALHAA